MDYINAIENCLGIEAKKELMPLQLGDVPFTSSNCCELESWIDYRPRTTVEVGVEKFINWYKEYYGI